jgi:very-short-patch-repair endonuclease
MGPYVLDFYCEALRLAVEVDGELHALDDRPQRDATRDRWFAERGIRTLRIAAREVLACPEGAALSILEYVAAAPSDPPGHLPQRGRS